MLRLKETYNLCMHMNRKNIATEKCQPEEIPAADPAATRDTFLLELLSNKELTPLAMDAPISTLGPSGPNEFPVPRVTQAATAFKNG